MAVIYNVAVKAARLTATRDYFAAGTLEILSVANQVLAIFELTSDGGDVAGDLWTLEFDAAAVEGEAAAGVGTTATKAQIKTSGGAAHLTGLTVGTADAEPTPDVVLSNTSISSGQAVELLTSTIQHAA